MAPRRTPDRMLTFSDIDWGAFEDKVPAGQGGGLSVTVPLVEEDDGSLLVDFHTTVMFDPWRVVGTARAKGGRVEIVRLCVEPQPNWQTGNGNFDAARPGGVTSALLRSVHVGRLLTWIRHAMLNAPHDLQRVDAILRELGETPNPAATHGFMGQLAEEARQPPPGRRGKGDDFYRRVALLYLDLQRGGWGRGIVVEMARQLDRPKDTVSTWVRVARDRGYLTRGTPGSAGAMPGPRLTADEEAQA